MKRLVLLISLMSFLSSTVNAVQCTEEDVMKAFASYICSTSGYKYGHCSLEKNAARGLGIPAGTITAAFLAMKAATRDLRRYAELTAKIKDIDRNDAYISGKISALAGAAGRTVDNPDIIHGVQQEAQEAALAKDGVRARRASLMASLEGIQKRYKAKGVDIAQSFRELSTGRRNIFRQVSIPGTSNYRYEFNTKNAFAKRNTLWRLAGKSVSATAGLAASGLGGGILGAALVEVPFAIYNSKDAANRKACEEQHEEYSPFFKVEVTTGIYNPSTCKLTSHVKPGLKDFFDFNQADEGRRKSLLESPVFCEKIKGAIEKYKVSVPEIQSFACVKTGGSLKKIAVYVNVENSAGEVKKAPVFITTNAQGLVEKIQTGFNGNLGNNITDHEVSASFSTVMNQGTRTRETILDLETVVTKEFRGNNPPVQRVSHVFTDSKENSVDILSHRRVREVAFLATQHAKDIKQMSYFCNKPGGRSPGAPRFANVEFNPNSSRSVRADVRGEGVSYSIQEL